MPRSKIEWTERTWNPTTGCTKVSKGCKFCYAEPMSRRLQMMGVEKYKKGFEVSLSPGTLGLPYTWKKPKVVFVNSMSDLFHEQIPLGFIKEVFKVMRENPRHIFQVLTKRENRLLELHDQLKWAPNIWMGVSVEDRKNGVPRIGKLKNIEAAIKFLSVEPLLEDIGEVDLTGINWVIVGGESGAKARPMKKEWAINIQQQCKGKNVAFFFKQWGSWGSDGIKRNKKLNGRMLEGKEWDQYPEGIV